MGAVVPAAVVVAWVSVLEVLARAWACQALSVAVAEVVLVGDLLLLVLHQVVLQEGSAAAAAAAGAGLVVVWE